MAHRGYLPVIPACLILGILLIVFSGSPAAAASGRPTEKNPRHSFNFEDVSCLAESLAGRPFTDSNPPLPDIIRNLNYDQYRDIRFRAEKTLWIKDGVPFTIRFFHRGFYFSRKVAINVVENGMVRRIPFSMAFFDHGRNHLPADLQDDLGFAGFQIFYPLYEHSEPREIGAFLGASYFRMVGRDQAYGLSARGLAIDTGLTSPEEFPFFREFWIEKPDRNAKSITIYALLDSPSAAGAYRFIITPGSDTTVETRAKLIFRKSVRKLGISPLTSMYLHGPASEYRADDFRPQVHDSDGLLIASGNGEWIWRPLVNPSVLCVNSFQNDNPRGFGLFQRDRNFDHYQDLEALYQKRPSSWVEPIGRWGKGSVELVQIPSEMEINDNIVAFWVPEKPALAGDSIDISYRIHFCLELPGCPPGGKTLSTRTGRGGGVYGKNPDIRLFVIDFSVPSPAGKTPYESITPVVSASSGKISNLTVLKNEFSGLMRVSFELEPGSSDPVELRCFLKSRGDTLTETWTYTWTRKLRK